MTNRVLLYLPLAILLTGPFSGSAWQGDQFAGAMADLQRGDFQNAETKLRAEIVVHPENAWALSLLGSALDNLKRVEEADGFHRHAVELAPRSTDVLNNYAAHLWLAGDEKRAADVYREVVALDPSHYNANLQLARLALQEKQGQETLRCLDRIAANQREDPQVLLPRLAALYLIGDRPQADALAERLLTSGDASLSFAAGVALSNVQQFAKAEGFLENALRFDPANFTVLYALGTVAVRAGDNARAREVLESARHQRPQNVDVLYALACADYASKQWETAVQLLSQAAKLEPRRADVQKMLAIAGEDLGALDDALAAWDRYLQLEPKDDGARRERGYTAAQAGQTDRGIADLKWYLSRHSRDVVGYYELAQAERSIDLAKAKDHLDRALDLDPNYVPARTARGSLYYQEGDLEAALKDLEVATRLRPDDPASLDRLGQTYQALDRNAEAVRVLRKAAELAPADSKTLLHFARALADAGDTAESKAVMDRFRQLGPEKRSGVAPGFVEYLSLSDGERHAEYRRRLEKAIQAHPGDAPLRLEFLRVLLADGNLDRAASIAQTISGFKDGAVLAEAGHVLLAASQYGEANQLLHLAEAAHPSPAVELDLANLAFRQGDPAHGLELLDRLPEASRTPDYYLSHAEMMDASGNPPQAFEDLEQAFQTGTQSPDQYRRAAAFLLQRQRAADAARLLDRAARTLPQNREILLMRAAAAELAGKTDDAELALAAIQERWPEWQMVWTVHGMILAMHRHFEEGRKTLATAEALGATSPGLSYYLAECALGSANPDKAAADAAIGEALRKAPSDTWIQALSRRITQGGGERKPPEPAGTPPYLFQLVFMMSG
ncbi:MAG TPA: tetratricopeptide repeat protein [Bryobacteraceae bacterium]|nr:tetratricopeptide repeat protein [Bryobacteraceae bacterium]